MITSLTIRALGPHDDTTLTFDPDGLTVLSGPSEAGKSSSLEATCYALWGCGSDGRPLPAELVRDGKKRAEVIVRLASGTTITRTLTRGRQVQRAIRKNGDERAYTREEEFRAALGKLGAYAEPARLVMAPFAWVEPSRGPGGGRPLRDLLGGVLPEVDLAAIVARLMEADGQPMQPTDPLTEERAVDLRRRTHGARDQALGRKQALEVLVAKLEAETLPSYSEDAIAGARSVLDASAAWGRYDLDRERWNAANAEQERRKREREAWLARRAELGDRPSGNAEAEVLAQRAVEQAERDLSAARAEVHLAETKVAVARAWPMPTGRTAREAAERALGPLQAQLAIAARRVETLEAHGDTCPTCGRAGWERAATELQIARQEQEALAGQVRSAEDALERASQDDRASFHAAEAERAAAIAAAEDLRRGAQERVTPVYEEVSRARAHLDAVRQEQAVPRAWDARLRALGPEPMVPHLRVEAPVELAGQRPTASQVAEARAMLADADRARGAAAQRERDKAQASDGLMAATDALEELVRECARLDALVEAVRRAPSEAAREQIAVFGDLGPVTIRFPSEGPAVEVLIDDRPWWLASTGRQIVGDAWLRAGLRRALSLPWLPTWIDRVQDVGGQDLPALDGPVVLLRTTDGGALESSAARERRSA